MKLCPICEGRTIEHGRAQVLCKYTAIFLKCLNCSFIFVPDPTWLSEAYADPISQSDTGYVWRNLWARDKVCHIVKCFLNPDGTFLDYGAGCGLLVRMMRDVGYDFRWSDLYCKNLFACGFEAPVPLTGSFEAVTAFEVFEHLTNPREEVQKLVAVTSCLVFSTRIVPNPAPQPVDWWYYGLAHGQHVAFYTRKSLEVLASQFNYWFATNGDDLHVLSRKPFPAKILLQSKSYWQRLWERLKGEKSRPSLTMSDYNFIENLRRKNG